MAKALGGLAAAFLVAIVGAHTAYRFTIYDADGPGTEAWTQDRMEFIAWNNEFWTAWVNDGAFEQAPEDTAHWSRHSKPSIAYIDWDGEAWQAKIEGDMFLLARHGNWDEEVETSEAIRYRDWSGNKQIRTVAQLRR